MIKQAIIWRQFLIVKSVGQIIIVHFASLQSSLDPQKTKDGEPYAPIRYQEIVRERYFITKNSGISYDDTGKMTPTERGLYCSFILEEFEKTKQVMDEAREKANQQRQQAQKQSQSRNNRRR